MVGTLVNVGTVIVGSSLGLLLHTRLPRKFTVIVFQVIGLFTLFLGFSMALKTTNFLVMVFSGALGAVLGELCKLEEGINNLGENLKHRLKSDNDKFAEGLVTAFLMFCMGSMTILGALEEGMGGKPNLLLAKSLLDGFSSMILASGLGIGVLLSVIPLFIYQGGLTLLASLLGDVLNPTVINEMTAVGGLMLIGLGFNILEIKTIKVINMLPGLIVAIILAAIFL
ncbi:MAG TPA: DUF554 domain-containing protein [Candidatus Marinimicrobia bacterium]|nr:DUF554 domain-containing protein [Candidatus Neomarinimicrobiota bacterium]HRS52547.1 DUF554 domain-containing protein [Candidatus Neomarinimicrobiota bacterium]HRU93162.1 DUF554 domain-containing protein [Candidatus Neomarinimicrobiota bacterium]